MNFIIDTVGNNEITPDEKKGNFFLDELFKEYKESSVENQIEEPTTFQEEAKGTKLRSDVFVVDPESKKKLEKILKKSVITPDLEKLHVVPPYEESDKKLREQRKLARQSTKGRKWYGMPATEVTEEIKRDLEILQMRSVLDPKRFYKKNDLKVLPKYFQIGKVMDSPLDFYNNRLTKKERKKTLADELLADAEFNKYNKRKYQEILQEKQKTHYKAWREAKRLKKKNKK